MTTPSLAPPAHSAATTTSRDKALGDAKSRPQGVWWARTSAALGSRFCEDTGHAVVEGLHARPLIGKPGETEAVPVWCCAVCWTGRPLPPVPLQKEKEGERA